MTFVWAQLAEALADRRLVVSGFGRWGGGVYDITDGRVTALDDAPTSGLTVGGDRLWRALRAPGEQTAPCELLSYDDRGLRSYRRLDQIRDPHDVCWHDGAVHVSSSWDATVWRVGTDDGHPRPVWHGGPVPDSWHVNSLVVVDGRLHLCAFGRFDRHKGWKGDPGRGTGFVHDVELGRDVLTGLDRPHCPRWQGDRWYVCESTPGLLTELDAQGSVRRRIGLRRFTRGLAIVGRWALVGGNAHRDSDTDRAEIFVVDLSRLEVVDALPMPCLEVYDIVTVPAELAHGLAVGFGANPARAVEQHRRDERTDDQRATPDDVRLSLTSSRVAADLARAGQRLDRSVTRRCRVDGEPPTEMAVSEIRLLTVAVDNDSSATLATVPPRPVRVAACWAPVRQTADDTPEIVNPRAALPHAVKPGGRATLDIILEAPDEPGVYEVVVGLHQSGTGWFGETAPTTVTVTLSAEAA